MTEPRFYFPVDRQLTPEELARVSIADIEHRDLNDPRYTGFEASFDWHRYITLDPNNSPTFNQRILTCLDQFARTAEGQQTIRQSYAMQQQRAKEDPEYASGKIRIAESGYGENFFSFLTVKLGVGITGRSISDITGIPLPSWMDPTIPGPEMRTGFHFKQGTVYINPTQIQSMQYLGADGRRHPASFEHVLFHELGHAKDGMNTEQRQDGFHKRLGWSGLDETLIGLCEIPLLVMNIETSQAHWWEMPVIRETNGFIEKYFGEASRAGHNETYSLPLVYGWQDQPNLQGDHTYKGFVHPPATPQGPKPPRSNGPGNPH